MTDDYRDFSPEERPKVEVLVENTWYAGELRAWSRPRPAGGWWANVSYRVGQGKELVATVRSYRVRKADPPG